MADRDYAAPLKPERRKSLWARITDGLHLTTDWDSAPPLTAGLREQFPDLAPEGAPVEEFSPVPPVPETLQLGYHTAASSNLRHTRNDSVQEGSSHSTDQCGPRAVSQTAYQQRSASNIIYQRNAHSQLLPTAYTPSRNYTIRRRPVQSSLHNQVHQEDSRLSHVNETSANSNNSTANNEHFTPGALPTVGYSHIPVYSPLPSTKPHGLPPPHVRSSPAARHAASTHTRDQTSSGPYEDRGQGTSHPSVAELQGVTSGPANTSLSLSELQELERSLMYTPPGFPHIPLLPLSTPPILLRSAPSNASVATSENPNPSSRPLNLFEANIAGLKQHFSGGH
ncbi:hypothetical protein BU25DRAFT_476780 [Macroventuria anomochaeta]|uniref:Uncharacterized protein n=1 Tax=Macroventuria anomochaeta TaxID=301207 RepID=A0ACB6RQ82_9PLEO|nr:uncharacterized protein BU25DRAFT_476780 [Macroventuria anomochaeta]KAF2624125.1 hypothetical protein BU25DRAFT_476780 [Macroventuria anomochaeta]